MCVSERRFGGDIASSACSITKSSSRCPGSLFPRRSLHPTNLVCAFACCKSQNEGTHGPTRTAAVDGRSLRQEFPKGAASGASGVSARSGRVVRSAPLPCHLSRCRRVPSAIFQGHLSCRYKHGNKKAVEHIDQFLSECGTPLDESHPSTQMSTSQSGLSCAPDAHPAADLRFSFLVRWLRAL